VALGGSAVSDPRPWESPLPVPEVPIGAPPAPVQVTPVMATLAALPWRAFLLFALVYLYAFPYFDKLRSANEMPRILMTQEIVDHRVFYLDGRLRDMGSLGDLSRGPDGHLYPNKAPGPSFLAIPTYLACKALGFTSLKAVTWAFRITCVTLPALLFLPVFYRLTRRFTPAEPARRTALAAYGIASPALPYGLLFFSHQLAAVCAGTAFVAAVSLVRREARHPEDASAATGFFAALAVMMDYQAALAAAVVGLYALIGARRRLRTLLLLAAGALPVVVLLAGYHAICFGSPLKTGYAYSFDTVTRQGFMGIVGLSKTSMFSTFLMPANGLFVLAPWVALALVGAVAIFRDPTARARVGAEAAVALLIFTGYLLFVSSLVPYMARGGWCVGPRYLTTCLPFAAWLAAAGFAVADRRKVLSVLAQSLVIAAAVIYLVAITTYPHWPDQLLNPLYELAFRLLRHGYTVHSLGTALGLRGLKAALPLYLYALGLLVWLLSRGPGRSWWTTGVACLLGGLIIVGHRAFPLTGPYAERAWLWVTATWEP
jgi:hypothetical protein